MTFTCASCANKKAVFQCSGCKREYYCSEKCQKKHWTKGKHSEYCNIYKNETIACSLTDTFINTSITSSSISIEAFLDSNPLVEIKSDAEAKSLCSKWIAANVSEVGENSFIGSKLSESTLLEVKNLTFIGKKVPAESMTEKRNAFVVLLKKTFDYVGQKLSVIPWKDIIETIRIVACPLSQALNILVGATTTITTAAYKTLWKLTYKVLTALKNYFAPKKEEASPRTSNSSAEEPSYIYKALVWITRILKSIISEAWGWFSSLMGFFVRSVSWFFSSLKNTIVGSMELCWNGIASIYNHTQRYLNEKMSAFSETVDEKLESVMRLFGEKTMEFMLFAVGLGNLIPNIELSRLTNSLKDIGAKILKMFNRLIVKPAQKLLKVIKSGLEPAISLARDGGMTLQRWYSDFKTSLSFITGDSSQHYLNFMIGSLVVSLQSIITVMSQCLDVHVTFILEKVVITSAYKVLSNTNIGNKVNEFFDSHFNPDSPQNLNTLGVVPDVELKVISLHNDILRIFESNKNIAKKSQYDYLKAHENYLQSVVDLDRRYQEVVSSEGKKTENELFSDLTSSASTLVRLVYNTNAIDTVKMVNSVVLGGTNVQVKRDLILQMEKLHLDKYYELLQLIDDFGVKFNIFERETIGIALQRRGKSIYLDYNEPSDRVSNLEVPDYEGQLNNVLWKTRLAFIGMSILGGAFIGYMHYAKSTIFTMIDGYALYQNFTDWQNRKQNILSLDTDGNAHALSILQRLKNIVEPYRIKTDDGKSRYVDTNILRQGIQKISQDNHKLISEFKENTGRDFEGLQAKFELEVRVDFDTPGGTRTSFSNRRINQVMKKGKVVDLTTKEELGFEFPNRETQGSIVDTRITSIDKTVKDILHREVTKDPILSSVYNSNPSGIRYSKIESNRKSTTDLMRNSMTVLLSKLDTNWSANTQRMSREYAAEANEELTRLRSVKDNISDKQRISDSELLETFNNACKKYGELKKFVPVNLSFLEAVSDPEVILITPEIVDYEGIQKEITQQTNDILQDFSQNVVQVEINSKRAKLTVTEQQNGETIPSNDGEISVEQMEEVPNVSYVRYLSENVIRAPIFKALGWEIPSTIAIILVFVSLAVLSFLVFYMFLHTYLFVKKRLSSEGANLYHKYFSFSNYAPKALAASLFGLGCFIISDFMARAWIQKNAQTFTIADFISQ